MFTPGLDRGSDHGAGIGIVAGPDWSNKELNQRLHLSLNADGFVAFFVVPVFTQRVKRHSSENHLMEVQRLTPDEFKAVFKQRGWTGKTLAVRWEVSEAWISKIVKNPQRAAHWDDAVRGLPENN